MNENYDSNLINQLEDIDNAHEKFKSMDGLSLVNGPLKNLFIKYKVFDTYGAGILHSHFPLKQTERLVTFTNTSIAIDVNDLNEDVKQSLKPSSFIFDDEGVLHSFEYTYKERQHEKEKLSNEFIYDLYKLLYQTKFINLICLVDLTLIPKGFEQTQGFANITIPKHIFNCDRVDNNKYLDVVWSFSPFNTQVACERKCFMGFNNSHQPLHFHWGEK